MAAHRPKPALEWLHRITSGELPDSCLEWPFATDPKTGYGIININGTSRTAHRVALILHSKQDPSDMQASHGPCHNRKCCNPKHLSWKTCSENHGDKVRDNTHNRGSRHYLAKLSEQNVKDIIADTRKHSEIAADYSVSRTVITSIKNKHQWKWITNEKRTQQTEGTGAADPDSGR